MLILFMFVGSMMQLKGPIIHCAFLNSSGQQMSAEAAHLKEADPASVSVLIQSFK